MMEEPRWVAGVGSGRKRSHEGSRPHPRMLTAVATVSEGPCWASLGTWCPLPSPPAILPHQRLGLQEPAWHPSWVDGGLGTDKGGTLQPLRSHSHPRQPRRPSSSPGLSLFSDPAGSSLVALPSPYPLTADLVSDSKPPWTPRGFWPLQGCHPSLGSCSFPTAQLGRASQPLPPSPPPHV